MCFLSLVSQSQHQGSAEAWNVHMDRGRWRRWDAKAASERTEHIFLPTGRHAYLFVLVLSAGNRPGSQLSVCPSLSLALLLIRSVQRDQTRQMMMLTRSIPSQLEHLHAHPGLRML